MYFTVTDTVNSNTTRHSRSLQSLTLTTCSQQCHDHTLLSDTHSHTPTWTCHCLTVCLPSLSSHHCSPFQWANKWMSLMLANWRRILLTLSPFGFHSDDLIRENQTEHGFHGFEFW